MGKAIYQNNPHPTLSRKRERDNHIHILGISGKFMSGLALIAKQMGLDVSGSDQTLLPEITDPLEQAGIRLYAGYDIAHLSPAPDCVVIGNTMSRNNPVIEHILNHTIPYLSGPEWLYHSVLKNRWVIGVAGTHGKTTTTSMVAWILEQAGLNPGFLIGGQPNDFSASARYTDSSLFVIEADEYDTAFFDKRSKFVHYHPRSLIINNIEFDHADIFKDLASIQLQFHHLLRTIPSNGLLITPSEDDNVNAVIAKGCWTPVVTFGKNAMWHAVSLVNDNSQFDVFYQHEKMGTVRWSLCGQHNVLNALAAIAATHHSGVPPAQSISALTVFQGVKRRLELKGCIKGISIYDDFAHHPTAIATTLSALRTRVSQSRIFAVIEFGSYTMRNGFHDVDDFVKAFRHADHVFLLNPKESQWDPTALKNRLQKPVVTRQSVSEIIDDLIVKCQPDDHVLIMSNQTFDNIHQRLLEALKT